MSDFATYLRRRDFRTMQGPYVRILVQGGMYADARELAVCLFVNRCGLNRP